MTYCPSKDVKKEYSRPGVAEEYDARRFVGRAGEKRNARKIRTIAKALRRIDRPSLILDLPCGTGRLVALLTDIGCRFVEADISQPMLDQASAKLNGTGLGSPVAADADGLPFKDRSFDVVLSIRFLFHLGPEARVRALREMARVCRGHLVIDYRLKYSLRNVMRTVLAKLGLRRRLRRPTRKEMLDELSQAGLEVIAVFPVFFFFSDKYILLCQPLADALTT